LLALLAAFAPACHGGKGATSPGVLSGPPGLRFAPADAVYAFAMLEPPPPALLTQYHSTLQSSLKSDPLLSVDPGDLSRDSGERVSAAILQELAAAPSAQIAEFLGISPSSRMVLYGVGAWPVLRMEITDEAKLKALVGRVATRAKVSAAEKTASGGRSYWQWELGGAVLVMATSSAEVVFAMAPPDQVESILPNVLGLSPPAKNLANVPLLGEVIQRHGLRPVFSGYFDLQRLVALPEMAQAMAALPPECPGEIQRLIALAPRLVFGYRRMDAIGFHGALTLESPLFGSALAAIGAPTPGVDLPMPPGAMVTFGLALDLEKTLKLMGIAADAVDRTPFRCPALEEMNELPTALRGARAAVPAELRGFRGMSLVVDDLDAGAKKMRGAAVVVMPDAINLVRGLGALGLPVNVQDDGVPVALPLASMGFDWGPAYLSVRGDRLALTMGDGALTRAATVLGAAAPKSSPLAAWGFDVEKFVSFASSAFGAEDAPDLLASQTATGTMTVGLTASSAGISLELIGEWPAAKE
jgi:hypothetical protein